MFYLVFHTSPRRFLISRPVGYIRSVAKKVLFTKENILFAYQSAAEERLKIKERNGGGEQEGNKELQKRKSVNPRFISELFSPSSLLTIL